MSSQLPLRSTKVFTFGFLFMALAALTNCKTVESYQKMYINDRDMELSVPLVQSFELDSQTFREGASGGNGGKTGGGCGCN